MKIPGKIFWLLFQLANLNKYRFNVLLIESYSLVTSFNQFEKGEIVN